MTDHLSIPADFTLIEIETPDGTPSFHGKLLGRVDNERRGRPRWAEIELYKYVVTDPEDPYYGEQVYLLHTMGHSVVYHRHDSSCNRGISVCADDIPRYAEFPEDLEPCQDMTVKGNIVSRGCYPPDWRHAAGSDMFSLEVLRHSRFTYPTADDVLAQLRRPSRVACTGCGSRGSTDGDTCLLCHGRGYRAGAPVLTAPGQRLLEAVRHVDEPIARAMDRKITL